MPARVRRRPDRPNWEPPTAPVALNVGLCRFAPGVTDIGLLFLGALVVACPVVMGVQAVRVGRGMIRVPLLVVWPWVVAVRMARKRGRPTWLRSSRSSTSV